MESIQKRRIENSLLVVIYVCITLPMVYSIYNAVPASDDFAASTILYYGKNQFN